MTPSQLYWELEDLVGYNSKLPESVDRYNAWIAALRTLSEDKLTGSQADDFEGYIAKAQSRSSAEILAERGSVAPEQILAIALMIFPRRLDRDS